MLRFLLTGKKNIAQNEPSWSSIFSSLLAPFTLITKKIIIAAFQAYSPIIIYLWILKLLGKKIIFYTSWPYWHTSSYIKKPLPGIKLLWHSFLRRVPIVAVTRQAQTSLHTLNSSAKYIPHTVDTTIFAPKTKNKKKNIELLYVGRLIPEKGIFKIIGALEEITKKYPVHLTIIGDGPLSSFIEEKSRSLPITYLGHIKNEKELAEKYASADIFIMASMKSEKWEEWFGITVIEAMSSGCVVISTNCLGPKEHLQHMKTGIIIQEKDSSALSKAIELLIKKPQLRFALGKAARQYAIQNYDAAKCSEEWMNILKE